MKRGEGEPMAAEEKGLREVARFESNGDPRVVRVGRSATGELTVEEIVAGMSCAVAYGESSHTMRMTFSSKAAKRLLEELAGTEGLTSVTDFVRDEANALVDLMDLCDAQGIPYGYMDMGDEAGLHFRPAE